MEIVFSIFLIYKEWLLGDIQEAFLSKEVFQGQSLLTILIVSKD